MKENENDHLDFRCVCKNCDKELTTGCTCNQRPEHPWNEDTCCVLPPGVSLKDQTIDAQKAEIHERDASIKRLEAEIFTLRAKIKGAEAEISSLCSEVQSLKEKLRALDSEYMEEVKKFGDALAVERAAAGKLIETIEQIRSTNGLQYSDIFAMCDYAIAAYRERHNGEQAKGG